ncbi:MAG: hypothetical protein MUP22_01535 [Desulfobacterales bacterium]|nr:hypothetical protein [Desulfobacterales bacterium]
MTTTQSIFVVFFAIFGGAIASVQGRWKMFHWTLIKYGHVARRLVLSMFVLNVLPVFFFACMFFFIRNTPVSHPSVWSFAETLRQVIAGVVPAFAVFAFYRLWLGVVEICPTSFYQNAAAQADDIKDIEPTIESLNVGHKWWLWNIGFAVLYLLVATLIPLYLVP